VSAVLILSKLSANLVMWSDNLTQFLHY